MRDGWYLYVVVFGQSNEPRCYVDHSDVVGAAPTGDAPTTSEWSTILVPTKVPYIRDLTVSISSKHRETMHGYWHRVDYDVRSAQMISRSQTSHQVIICTCTDTLFHPTRRDGVMNQLRIVLDKDMSPSLCQAIIKYSLMNIYRVVSSNVKMYLAP